MMSMQSAQSSSTIKSPQLSAVYPQTHGTNHNNLNFRRSFDKTRNITTTSPKNPIHTASLQNNIASSQEDSIASMARKSRINNQTLTGTNNKKSLSNNNNTSSSISRLKSPSAYTTGTEPKTLTPNPLWV